MRFSTAFVTSAFVAAAVANPIEKRQTLNLIEMWDEEQFLGLKLTGAAQLEECKNLPDFFNNIIESARAAVDGVVCSLYVDKGCTGLGFSFNRAGARTLPDWIENKASSWKCFK